jgi:osmoprotectant transport system substrate-binding protein
VADSLRQARRGRFDAPAFLLPLLVCLTSLAALTACHSSERIVVGAKNFTESDLLAEIVAQQIERRTGLPVERRLHMGGTFVCHRALVAGEIDLYVEYTGTALSAVLKHPSRREARAAYDEVALEYRRRFGLEWGAPFGFDNTFAIAVRRADAERHRLQRISDLVPLAPRLRAGFGYEFLERHDGYPGLSRVYGLEFASPPTAMDLGLTYRALAEGKVDLIAGNSTDPQIQALDLVALDDDRGYFPPYQAAPVMRADLSRRHPEVAAALAELGGQIDEAEMRRLNLLADIEHRDVAGIAREWLARRIP